jgi:long-chain acyl-CoA synthetase
MSAVSSNFKRTITQVFLEARNKPVTQVALRYSDGKAWHDISWPEYFKTTEKIAAGLAALGVKRGDRVAILSNTRYHWAMADLAILGLGAVTVPVYQNSTAEDVSFILNNSEATAAFVEDQSQLLKVKKTGKNGVKIVTFNAIGAEGAMSWQSLMNEGEKFLKKQPHFFEEECKKNKLEDMATIVYTSGTTGTPKGVVLLFSCIASECEDIQKEFNLGDQDSTLTFLPFAHIFGRVELWANIYLGWTICFAESIDRIAVNLKEIKPTFMMAVPRIFEKIYTKITSQIDEEGGLRKKLFRWAVEVGRKVSAAKMNNEEVPLDILLQYQLAYKLVFSKINKALGGRLRFLVSGGAPLAKEIAEFFHASGVLVLEGYGLTETTAAITVNTPYKYRFGTVGPTLGDAQIKFAADGEILVRSEKVFKEYFKNPEATQESLEQGWFHTGDIGELDEDGFLKITDRKKDLIKTAGGKIVAPQKLENLLKTNKYINQVVIYGDKMKYLVALVTVNEGEIKKYATTHGISFKDLTDLAKDPKINELINSVIRETNSTLASFETIKHFTILPTEFTIENGELTPSLKVKRKFLSQKYEDLIKTLY